MLSADIETERLLLQPWAEEHGPLLVELSSDPRTVRHIAHGETWRADFALTVADRQRNHWIEHGFGWRAALEKATRQLIGFSALNFLDDGTEGLEANEYEIGWWLAPSAWGRGFAVEGGRATLAEAFGRVGAPSVVARIQPSNEPSIRVADALGMRHEISTTGSHGEPVEIFRLSAES